MSWRDSDHARLIALKQKRAAMRRVPDEQVDKPEIRKLTIEIKEIRTRLIADEKAGGSPEGLRPLQVAPEVTEASTEKTIEEATEEAEDPSLVPEGVLEAHTAWKDKTAKWTDFVKASGGVHKAKEYREIIESDD